MLGYRRVGDGVAVGMCQNRVPAGHAVVRWDAGRKKGTPPPIYFKDRHAMTDNFSYAATVHNLMMSNVYGFLLFFRHSIRPSQHFTHSAAAEVG